MKQSHKGLNELAKETFDTAFKNGFYDEPKPKSERLMLMVSELAEALEADRQDRFANLPLIKSSEPTDDKEWKIWFDKNIKDTYEDELADTVIRLLDHFQALGADANFHVTRKMKYNTMRPYKHGKKY